MTKKEFLTKLYDLKGWVTPSEFLDRRLNIVILKSSYGNSTTAILEMEGSPPKMKIIVDIYHLSNEIKSFDTFALETNMFVFNSKNMSSKARKRKEMLSLIYSFLQSNVDLSRDEDTPYIFYSI